MSKKRGERTPDEKPITAIRPKASPCIVQNDGFGNTPFQRVLLFWLSTACIILFAIVFILFMALKIKQNSL